jgi:hypothetical protein
VLQISNRRKTLVRTNEAKNAIRRPLMQLCVVRLHLSITHPSSPLLPPCIFHVTCDICHVCQTSKRPCGADEKARLVDIHTADTDGGSQQYLTQKRHLSRRSTHCGEAPHLIASRVDADTSYLPLYRRPQVEDEQFCGN